MPKASKRKAYYKVSCLCPSCGNTFSKQVGLSLHLYHNPKTCGRLNTSSALKSVKNLTVMLPSLSQSRNCVENNVNENDDDDDDDDNAIDVNDSHDGDDDNNNFEIFDSSNGTNEIIHLSPATLKNLQGEVGSSVTHLAEQRVHTELIKILDDVGAPDYLFQKIINWASHAQSLNYNFCPRHVSRIAAINDLKIHFNMHSLSPTINSVQLEAAVEEVPIVSFPFQAQLTSLLTNSELMAPSNLVLNSPLEYEDGSVDYAPWFLPYDNSEDDNVLDEVLSGQWYKETVSQLSANETNKNLFVCPLIVYVDKTFIDPMRSRFNLEPVNFTLGIFNRKSRQKFEFWRTLGYIPDHPSITTNKKLSRGYKARDYHVMLKEVLGSLIEIHRDPYLLDDFHLRIGNKVKLVNLRVPVAFVIADTQGADKLCGRYVSYNDLIQRLHRSCKCSPADACDTKHCCEWVTMDEMMGVIERGDKQELINYSQYLLPDHAFAEVDFGSNRFGIYGATPTDSLHVVKLGIIPYVLEVCFQNELTPSTRHLLNVAVKNTLPYLKQNGNKKFPRLSFPNGITSLTNLTAEEHVGILFTTFVLTFTSQGKQAFLACEGMYEDRVKLFLKLFEKLLILEAWMSNTNGFWSLGNRSAYRRTAKSISQIVDFITENFDRKSSQGWNLSKMHELLHITKLIELFGSPANFESGGCERLHKDIAKKPGRRTQKRHESFTLQAASRLADTHVIEYAHRALVSCRNVEEEARRGSGIVVQCQASLFDILLEEHDDVLHVSVSGHGSFSSSVDLLGDLYPDLVEFIVLSANERCDTLPKIIHCSTEMRDKENGDNYRAHPNYRSVGFWHDWAWVSWVDDTAEDGYCCYPAKILCFLPFGLEDDTPLVVIHSCGYECESLSLIVREWFLVSTNGPKEPKIPYSIVPLSSLCGHCLVVPDLSNPFRVFEIEDPGNWYTFF